MINKEKAIWKQYPKYSFIEVNQFGDVRITDRIVTYKNNGRKRFYKGHILKQQLGTEGYLHVRSSINKKEFNLLVHRMVAACFLPNPDNLPQVNHKDCNRTNNSVENLEWCTCKYNNQYREKYGKAFGRPVIATDLKTLKVLRFRSQSETARQLNVSVGNVCMVIKGRLKKTCGYWFCNADENAVEKARAKFGDDIANKIEKLIREG